jgi:hypothetical protein
MTPLQLALDRAQLRLIDRLDLLVGRADGGDESVYVALRDLTIALAQIRALVAPGAIGELLDTTSSGSSAVFWSTRRRLTRILAASSRALRGSPVGGQNALRCRRASGRTHGQESQWATVR